MVALINFKICDNSKECSGILACPTGALHWDKAKKKIEVDSKKCVSCGACAKVCPIGAIRIARSQEEYKQIQKEILSDKRNPGQLFVDRYGAEVVDSKIKLNESEFSDLIKKPCQKLVVELYQEDSIKCLLNSTPIKELFENYSVNYKKMESTEGKVKKEYKIKEFPAMLFFKDGVYVGKIEGYYQISEKEKLSKQIKNILG